MRSVVAVVLVLLAAAPAVAADPTALDRSYGAGGYAALPFGSDFAAAPGGGGGTGGGRGGFGIRRLDAEGRPAGEANLHVGTDARAAAVAVQADGRIVVAGSVVEGDRRVLAVARLTPELALDAAFANGGVARVADVAEPADV